MLEMFIEGGLILLLIYMPLAGGGIPEFSMALLELVSGLLVLLWLVQLFSQRKQASRRHRRSHRRTPSERASQEPYSIRFAIPAFTGLLILFVLLIVFQLCPLPGFLVNSLSPRTYHLYAEGAANTAAALPFFLPLSVYTSATEGELYRVLAYAALFLVIINTIRSSKQLKRLVYVLVALGFGQALYGLYQFSGEWFITGTFANRNHFAGYLEMVIPLALGLMFIRLEEQRGPAPLRKLVALFQDKYLKAVLLLCLVAVMICALVLTGSRGGMLSLTCGLICLGSLAYSRRLLRKWIIVLLIFVLLMFGVVAATSPAIIVERLQALTTPKAVQSFIFRWDVWKDAVRLFLDFPAFGSGLGTFSQIFPRYQRFPSEVTFTHAENDYLQLLVEGGILGIVIILGIGGLFFYATITAWKQRRSKPTIALVAGGLSAVFSLCIHSAVDFNLHTPSNAFLFTVIAALSYAAAHTHKKSHAMKTIRLSLSRARYTGLMLAATALIGCYLFQIVNSYYAFIRHEQFFDWRRDARDALLQSPAMPEKTHDELLRPINTAIRHDHNSASHYAALGNYLYEDALTFSLPEHAHLQQQAFQEAETWLRKAVMLNPSNSWHYYELGRVSISRGDCADTPNAHLSESCLTVRYLTAALQNAPMNRFLRKVVGRWVYSYDRDLALSLMEEIITKTARPPMTPEIMRSSMAKFFYDMEWDAMVENYLRSPEQKERAEECIPTLLRSKYQPATHTKESEFGNDDYIPEWRTYLIGEEYRVKKTICVPENFDTYDEASLKILMNNAGNGNFWARVMLDDLLIKEYHPADPVPRIADWYDIPFDKNILRGKAAITVYIRVSGTSHIQNFLQIWGDQDTPTTRSVFNFDNAADLSYHEGVQSGEYMIRLVLKQAWGVGSRK